MEDPCAGCQHTRNVHEDPIAQLMHTYGITEQQAIDRFRDTTRSTKYSMTNRALCVCNSGAVRSVTLQRMLAKRGWQALAVGVDDHDEDTLKMLCDWAYVIFPADQKSWTKLHMKVPSLARQDKVSNRHFVGPDDWKVPQHPDLVRIYRKQLGEKDE